MRKIKPLRRDPFTKACRCKLCGINYLKRKKKTMQNTFRVQYLRDTNNFPIGCLAIKLSDNFAMVSYQVSVLNPRDRFDRALSRQLAKGRLLEQPIEVDLPDDFNMHVITRVVMNDMQNNSSLPTRARKAARYWLRDSGSRRVKTIAQPAA